MERKHSAAVRAAAADKIPEALLRQYPGHRFSGSVRDQHRQGLGDPGVRVFHLLFHSEAGFPQGLSIRAHAQHQHEDPAGYEAAGLLPRAGGKDQDRKHRKDPIPHG